MNRDFVIDQLTKLPVEEFVELLRRVFEKKFPAPEEAAYCRTRFYLGTASSQDEADASVDDTRMTVPRWGPWERDVVAYVDAAEYDGDVLGPNHGLANEGTCLTCDVTVRSNVKRGLCPICGGKVYMT